jgi:hypothetical protein
MRISRYRYRYGQLGQQGTPIAIAHCAPSLPAPMRFLHPPCRIPHVLSAIEVPGAWGGHQPVAIEGRRHNYTICYLLNSTPSKIEETSCALRDQRGQRRQYWPPFAPWVQGGAGLGWVWSGGSNLAPGPLGSVAGGPDRHRGWLLCPLPLLRTGGCLPAGG